MQTEFKGIYNELTSDQPFESVVEAFEEATGSIEGEGFSDTVKSASTKEQFEEIVKKYEESSGFMRFLTLNHGSWMKKFEGGKTQSIMYTLGNPLIARTMLMHDMAAGLNVPVRLHIYEGSDGQTRIGYYQVSALMSVFKNEDVLKACAELDKKLDALAQVAARGKQKVPAEKE